MSDEFGIEISGELDRVFVLKLIAVPNRKFHTLRKFLGELIRFTGIRDDKSDPRLLVLSSNTIV